MAASLHRVRDAIREERRKRIAERLKKPSVADFYKGRNVFITGGSGFVGRMVIEQLLRTCPDIGTIYLVMRAKKGTAPQDRLQGLLDVPLYDRLRAERPGALSKLVVLPGDITELGLGLSREHQDLLRKEVSVVFHIAASVRFDDPFQKAVFTNVRSTREVVALARGMRLASLVHVSTAYTNVNQDPEREQVYPTHLDWRSVIRMAEEMDAGSLWAMDCLGPKLRDFQPNSYTFTKALAEVLINEVADELPVVIVRPSIVMPTFKDPIPGWIDNLYGLGAFWAAAWKGLIRVSYSPYKDVAFDSVPGDVVTKITILASWARGLSYSVRAPPADGSAPKAKGVEVVHATVGKVGCSYTDMEWVTQELSTKIACTGMIRDTKYTLRNNYFVYLVEHWYHHILYGTVLDLAATLTGKKRRAMKAYRSLAVGLETLKQFSKEFNFTSENQEYIQTLMHPKDEDAYCTLAYFSGRDNIENLCDWASNTIKGVLMYAMKEDISPKNLKDIPKIKMAMKLYHGTMAAIAGIAAYSLVPS
ncbi:fatty acyl-CoA reductase 1-like isoform X2 [Frankliniella occidentalis]|nr:fatty acyl-CoA reductase 1-like isoform X2 [Frankliniella occidentalis]